MSTSRGNVGEYLVMAELLARGFDTYLANRGNTAFDLACFWNGGIASRIRVKTTSNSSAIWSAKKDGAIFRDVHDQGDFCTIVDTKNGVRGAAIYIVPTRTVEEHILRDHAHYMTTPGRKEGQTARVLRFFGEDKPDNTSFAYDRKFAPYLEAWDLLRDR
jgi:hypothetical protein